MAVLRCQLLYFVVHHHLCKVLKDLDQDRASEIKGLPQIVGKKASITIAAVLSVIALVVLVIS